MTVSPPASIGLKELLLARMERWSRSSMADLYALDRNFAEPGAKLVEHLLNNRRELARWLRAPPWSVTDRPTWKERPEAFLHHRLVRWVHQRNQFLRVDGTDDTKELDALYRRSLLRAARLLSSPVPDAQIEEYLRGIFGDHQAVIAAFLRARLGEHPQEAVCAEYSPGLQVGVLGLAGTALQEPILDVGCGGKASLVRHLRTRGYEAVGLDRDAPQDAAVGADWLSFSFGTNRWGTVISHLGFSLHFLRHHLTNGSAANELALAHARAYMRILRSLRVGGVFAYAPALPFIEALLPASEYQVERVELLAGLGKSLVFLAAQESAGRELDYAARVRRLA